MNRGDKSKLHPSFAAVVFFTQHLAVARFGFTSGAPEAVSAFRAGALDFLIKPLDDETLLDAVAKALAVSAERQHQRVRRGELAARLATLTRREREVARRVAQCERNLQIAETLGIGLRTVKRHRHQAMEKLEVETVVDLVRLFDALSDFGSGDG